MKRVIPIHIRQMNADIAYFGIAIGELARRAKVGLSDTSRILNGWLNHPEKLAKLQRALDALKKGAAV